MTPSGTKRPPHSMLVALLALVLAMGGSAVAADQLDKGDVKRIAKQQVKRQVKPPRVTQLDLTPGWLNIDGGGVVGPARAYRDRFKVVHLAGLVAREEDSTETIALRLPRRMRPGFELELPVVCDLPGGLFDPRPGVVFIEPNGFVDPVSSPAANCEERLSLDGITFRAGG